MQAALGLIGQRETRQVFSKRPGRRDREPGARSGPFSGEGAPSGASMNVMRFIREARAGATAVTAAAVTVMTVFGAALIVDHVWLVDQRDLLKTAANAASIAATLELRELPRSQSDAEVKRVLQATAERYVRFNLAANLAKELHDRMRDTLVVSIDVNRALGTVGVAAKSDLGGTLLSRWVLDYSGPKDGIAVKSGAEASISTTEVVLVLDVTGSMLDGLTTGRVGRDDPSSRINIVKRAAEDLVTILAAHENSTIAVGIVPWTYRVRLNQSTRSQWVTKRWAVYPTERTYPHPTRGPPASSRFLSEQQSLPAQSRLPSACRAWAGCPDMRVDTDNAPSFSLALPSAEPFVMNFYTHHTSRPDAHYASYACQDYTRSESNRQGGEEPLCYDIDRVPDGQRICGHGDIQTDGPWRVHPQDNCAGAEITPLDSDLEAVRTAIRSLRASGSATYSSAGIAWGIRLLAPTWRDVWGDAEHPMDADSGVQKVIVLLTDGEDNHLNDASAHRQQGCTTAKNQGITIFTIAAMNPANVRSELARELTACSSQADDPDGTYVFLNNSTPAELRAAFAEIGRQLVSLKRTY